MPSFKELANSGQLVPNQNCLLVNKSETNGEDKENYYACINLAAMEEAAYNLKGYSFVMWCYICKNRNNYKFNLSRAHFKAYANCSDNAYRDSFKTLCDYGYLVLEEKGNNNNGFYTFYDRATKPTPYTEQITVIKFSEEESKKV